MTSVCVCIEKSGFLQCKRGEGNSVLVNIITVILCFISQVYPRFLSVPTGTESFFLNIVFNCLQRIALMA